MASVTLFDDLADLALIEIFSYLSSIDNIWAFGDINSRLIALLAERRLFRYVNLSSSRYRQFHTLLRLLPLDEVQSLTIDFNASPLQLSRWPYLPHLTRLHLNSWYDPNDVLIFLSRHAATLTYLKIGSQERYFGDDPVINVEHSNNIFTSFVNDIFYRLPELLCLDLSKNCHVIDWQIPNGPIRLTYLSVALKSVVDLIRIVGTPLLSETLEQMHVSVVDGVLRGCFELRKSLTSLLTPMKNLHTFTFVERSIPGSYSAWSFLRYLTHRFFMPALRQAYLALHITFEDLDFIGPTSLFFDLRRVDVHFVFILQYGHRVVDRHDTHIKVMKSIPRGARFHPREVISAPFLVTSTREVKHPLNPHGLVYYRPKSYQRIWYTLPWAFNDFFCPPIPPHCITPMGVYRLPITTTKIGASRLRELEILMDALSPVVPCLSRVVPLDRIQTLSLIDCRRFIPWIFPALRHVNLTNSPDSLENLALLSPSISSIRIKLLYKDWDFVMPNWSELRSLSALPKLTSLRLALFDVTTMPNDTSCQIIAEIASTMADFGFCFQRSSDSLDDELQSILNDYPSFIEQLRCRILTVSGENQPYYVVDSSECEIMVWF